MLPEFSSLLMLRWRCHRCLHSQPASLKLEIREQRGPVSVMSLGFWVKGSSVDRQWVGDAAWMADRLWAISKTDALILLLRKKLFLKWILHYWLYLRLLLLYSSKLWICIYTLMIKWMVSAMTNSPIRAHTKTYPHLHDNMEMRWGL